MAVSFTRFTCWLWGGKEKEPVSNSSTLNSSSEWGFDLKERESMKFPSVKGAKLVPSHRKVKRKWRSREERKIESIDRECDFELVPSDCGGSLSGSESDDSDWSVGWLEPLSPEFQRDDDSNDSFAVLVPCYRHGCNEMKSSNNELLSAITNLPNEFSSASKFMEQWLASLQSYKA